VNTPETKTPWGSYRVIYQDDKTWTKILTLDAGQSLSLHYHEFRDELWFPLSTGLRGIINGHPAIDLQACHRYDVPNNVLHRIINHTKQSHCLIEVSVGAVDEEDIIHIYNKHRRR
jgi:mannose-6-phosphate isomerase-like protein (cupin superfamily)